MNFHKERPGVAMRTYKRQYSFFLLVNMIEIIWLHLNAEQCLSMSLAIKQYNTLPYKCTKHHCLRHALPGRGYRSNCEFIYFSSILFYAVLTITWLIVLLLLRSGNVHPNPGPSSISSDTSSGSSASVLSSISLSRHLSFVHYNVQSIVPKLDILLTELYDFDILAFSETWLSPAVTEDNIALQSYQSPERKDRAGDPHGGVMIYVKEAISYCRRRDLEPVGIECIWIELTIKHKHILFGLFYRPPNSDSTYFTSIEDSVHLAVDTGIQDIVVTGDFNFNMLSAQLSAKIKNLCEEFSLTQTINQPTHFTEHSSSLLDIILTSNDNHLIFSGVGDPFLSQDLRYHCPVFGILNFSKPRGKSYVRMTWSYDRGDYNLLRQKASSTDWESFYDNDIDKHALGITDHITDIAKECIPNRITRIRPCEPSWITSHIKYLIRRRKRAYRKAKRTDLHWHWHKFRELRNKVTKLIRDSKTMCNERIANKLKSETLSSKDWWTTLKSVISPNSKRSVPPLQTNGIIVSDELEKANVLNDFFRDQTLVDDTNVDLPVIDQYVVHSDFSSLQLTPSEVETVLKSLPIGKAAGPDGINNRILRELAVELSLPFCSLFNQSLRTGNFPACWKVSHVCPIHKGGDRSIPSNYRPVSLLCNPEKSFERVVFKHFYNHLHSNNILTSLQSGFIPGDSTVNQLTYLYNTFCQALDSGKEVRVVFCDVSKAFDRVWHEGLLLKLEAAGITGSLLTWFRSYLTDRRQRVVLPGVQSNWNNIRAGVPQGSILGPLLFLLFINDIVEDIGSNIRLFADDTSLYMVVDNPDTAAELLNLDINKIMTWAKKWLVTFNPVKTESLLITRKLNRPIHPPLFMENQQITETDSHKHLGVYLSNDCTWHKHIDFVKEKAWKRINIMRKLKFEIDRKSLEIIFFTFIRPLLEYASVVWDNCTQYEKAELDKIQNEAARIVTGTTKLVSIHALYEDTKWETLEERRRKCKLILFYKITNGLSPTYLSSLIPPSVSSVSSYSLRNSSDIQTIVCRTTQYFNSFLPSVIREWNSLPLDVRNSTSVSSFKCRLKERNYSVPKYYYTGNRKLQILHARLRTKCSSLNYDLFLKRITESPLCRCGAIENTDHYLMTCQLYRDQRAELINTVSQQTPVTLHILLYGNSMLPLQTNIIIFEAVQKYINDTKRFKQHTPTV